jgi:hypothetical protein
MLLQTDHRWHLLRSIGRKKVRLFRQTTGRIEERDDYYRPPPPRTNRRPMLSGCKRFSLNDLGQTARVRSICAGCASSRKELLESLLRRRFDLR